VSTPQQMKAVLEEAIVYVNAGELEEGRALLERVLEQDPRNDRAWVWLSGCVEDPMQRRICLQQALAANPNNQAAIDGMMALEGKLVQASDVRPSLLESRLSAIGMGDQPMPEKPAAAVTAEPYYEEAISPVPAEFAEEQEADELVERRPGRGPLVLLLAVVLLLFLVVCALVVTQVLPVLLETFL
jgi:tetratricopeptide (TPR) repeat protein